MNNNSTGLFIVMAAMVFSTFYYGTTNRITPALEWACTFYIINFYAVMAFTNPFYDSIHQDDFPDNINEENQT